MLPHPRQEIIDIASQLGTSHCRSPARTTEPRLIDKGCTVAEPVHLRQRSTRGCETVAAAIRYPRSAYGSCPGRVAGAARLEVPRPRRRPGQVVALDREPRHIEPADGLSVRWTDASGPPITMPLSSLPAAIVPCGVAGLVKAVRSTRPAIRSGPGRHRRPGLVQDRGGGGLKAACGDRAGYFTEPAVNPFWICRWKIT
jgi:hypothetical protein